MNQNSKDEKNLENSVMQEITKVGKTCQKTCKICNSKNVVSIHKMRNDGNDFKNLVQLIEKKYGEKVSTASLCRHFKNYNKAVNNLSAEIINNDLVEKATLQSVHMTKVVKLIDLSIKSIEERMTSGVYKADVAELEKLMNMRYKLLTGDSDSDDMVALFQQASEKYGFQQAIVFNKPNSSVVGDVSV